MLKGLGLTQRKILEGLLENKEGMTIDHIGKFLDITRTAVNQHINSLERDGYVRRHTLTKTRGRPGQIYVLSEKGIALFPKRYAWFSALLLKSLKEKLGREDLEKILNDLGEQVASELASRLTGLSGTEKIMGIAALMKDLGYESTATMGDTEVISASNCVYHELASEIPEICLFDLALLSALSGHKIEHMECMVRGGCKCRFQIKEALQPPATSEYQSLGNPVKDE